MANIHEYPVTVQWQGGRDGSGSVTADRSTVSNKLSVPPEFQGPGDGTNPEELLASAVAACYTITFGIIAANQKLPVKSIEVKAVGEVEQAGAQFTYKKVTIRPRIVASADATDDQMAKITDMSHKADNYCIITNAIRGKVEVAVEPDISKG
ncbi:MAG: OsmC family protein [Chlorobia bacterium]|nr:OsmC family protein [Fimbriimonadaceae bacterium]